MAIIGLKEKAQIANDERMGDHWVTKTAWHRFRNRTHYCHHFGCDARQHAKRFKILDDPSRCDATAFLISFLALSKVVVAITPAVVVEKSGMS